MPKTSKKRLQQLKKIGKERSHRLLESKTVNYDQKQTTSASHAPSYSPVTSELLTSSLEDVCDVLSSTHRFHLHELEEAGIQVPESPSISNHYEEYVGDQRGCNETILHNDLENSDMRIKTPPSIGHSPICNPQAKSYRRKRLFPLRSPQELRVTKIRKTYSKVTPFPGTTDSPSACTPKITPKLSGRRLITIDAINEIIGKTEEHREICKASQLKVCSERRDGLHTIFKATCATCKKIIQLDNDFGEKTLEINEAIVWAGNVTGSGLTAIKHSMTVLDVPFLCKMKYTEIEQQFGESLKSAFESLLKKNGQEEKEIAVKLGQIDNDGVPWTDVIGDGQWSQRSFNQQGKALSGSAVLIGTLTKKPLFVGIRNKICYMCKTQPGKSHNCFQNYDGSSSGMETSIIREGFERSISMHGLRFKKFIGDGDSSVFVNIKDVYLTDPNYFTSVQKITCKLHAIRAMNRNLLNAQKNSNKNSGYPKEFRDMLNDRIHQFGKYTNFIIQRHIEMRPKTNAETLAEDLKALPHHIFGNHNYCSAVMCKDGIIIVPGAYKNQSENELNVEKSKTVKQIRPVPTRFFSNAIWTEIIDICNRLSELSASLLYNVNTNLAESFQSHVNKFSQGRRCNNVMRGGYNRKVQEATFSFMFGPCWYVKFHEFTRFDSSPLPGWLKAWDSERKKRERNLAIPQRKTRKFLKLGNSTLPEFFSRTRKPDGDKDYGPNAQMEDVTNAELDIRLEQFLKSKKVDSVEEQWKVHLDTVGQHSNEVYKARRTGLITASIVGELFGLRDSTSNVTMIDKILYPEDISNLPQIKWGLANEKKARLLYETLNGVQVQNSGLFVSLDFPGIGASPDGLVGEDGIIEIKCPYTERYSVSGSVANRKNNAYIRKLDEKYILRSTSHYYLQVVHQLHVTNRKWCDFVIWTQGALQLDDETQEQFPTIPEGHLLCIRIVKGEETTKKFKSILEKCKTFFYGDLGPEIANSRLARNMGYRQPQYRITAITALKMKKEAKCTKRKKNNCVG